MRLSSGFLLAPLFVLIAACDGTLPMADAGSGDEEVDGGACTGGACSPDGGTGDGDADCFEPAALGVDLVRTTEGELRGLAIGDTTAFLGVPYAEPPLGDLRFKAPTRKTCWEGEQLAAAYGDRCAQVGFDGQPAGDEDCLSLNVWTPADLSQTSGGQSDVGARPVLFWIHGGANVIGGSFENIGGDRNLFDGQHLAGEQDAVVVSINYRLGAFGFLAHDTLRDEDANNSAGNYAILDMIEALQWTQRNISAFGGDPERVMIFGESAGALDVCILMTSPLTEGLFSSALMQSGACEAPPYAERQAAGQILVSQLGCAGAGDVPACLRSLSAEAILEQSGDIPAVLDTWDLPFGPNVDGHVLTDEPMGVLEAGEQQPVPFIVGSNAHESEFFLPYTINTCFDVSAWLTQIFGSGLAAQVEQQYDCLSYPFARYALVDVLTDVSFTCPARRIARAASMTQPTWRYHYRYERADPQLTLLRAAHAMELAMVFGTYDRPGYTPPAAEHTLSMRMKQTWADFADDLEAPVVGGTSWPAYDTSDAMMVLDEALSTETAFAEARCDFWDAIAP